MTHKFVIKKKGDGARSGKGQEGWTRSGIPLIPRGRRHSTQDDSKWIKPTKQSDQEVINAADARISILQTDIGRTERGLDLNHLRLANVARSVDPTGFNHPLARWSIAEWTNALCGEAGEAANVAKKLIRIRYNTRGNKPVDVHESKLLRKLTTEMADAVIYADLTLASEGISLSDAVVRKYNTKSKEIGFNFQLMANHSTRVLDGGRIGRAAQVINSALEILTMAEKQHLCKRFYEVYKDE